MEFRDLKKQYQLYKKEFARAIEDVLETTNFISGSQVVELEEKLAEYVGVKHCITCANGTDALLLALMAFGVGEGDAVFVPDFTFFSTAEVVPWVQATPVFVDVEKDTFNISAESLDAAIQEVLKEGKLLPKVVVAVDLFGQPANYPKIRKIANKYKLLLLEDGAQGFGGAINDKRACSFGDISTTSFFPAKPLGCYGDGGGIFTENDEWAEVIRSLRVHGKGMDKYHNVRIGLNSRLDTLQAAILLVKLPMFQKFELAAVNQVAEWYSENLKNLDLICPQVQSGYYSSWAQYTILLPDQKTRDKLQSKLKESNIPSMVYYVKPMHEQPVFADAIKEYTEKDARFENTEQLCKRVLSLPMHPYMKKDEVEYVCNEIYCCLEKRE